MYNFNRRSGYKATGLTGVVEVEDTSGVRMRSAEAGVSFRSGGDVTGRLNHL